MQHWIKGIYWNNSEDGGYWQINKVYKKHRVWKRVFGDANEAEQVWIEEKRKIINAKDKDQRPNYSFLAAAIEYIKNHCRDSNLKDHARVLNDLCDNYGFADKELQRIHAPALDKYIRDRKNHGVKNRTINHAFEAVNGVLKCAATRMIDKRTGMTWLSHYQPLPKLSVKKDQRPPRPISWEEQDELMPTLPAHKAEQSLYLLNTAIRQGVMCSLQWDWEIKLPWGTGFHVPPEYTKSGIDQIIIHNSIAQSIIEAQRGNHPTRVFTYKGEPVINTQTSAWRKNPIRKKYGIRIHDFRHTAAVRLEAVGTPEDIISFILHHSTETMSRHYATHALDKVRSYLEKLCNRKEIVIIRRKA